MSTDEVNVAPALVEQAARTVCDEILSDLKERFAQSGEEITRGVASILAARLAGWYEGQFQALKDTGTIGPFEEAELVRVHDPKNEGPSFRWAEGAKEKLSKRRKEPPEKLQTIAALYLGADPTPLLEGEFVTMEKEDWVPWAEWAAAQWVRQIADLASHETGDGDALFDEGVGEPSEVIIQRFVHDVPRGLEDTLREAFDGIPSPVEIESLLGVGANSGSAPVPRPETEEMDPEPFRGDPPIASLLADPFSTITEKVVREADGKPGPICKGEWGEDSTGHPVRVEQLGNPYEGRATFKVRAFGEPDPTAVEASMGWKMLDRMDMDTVWLHLLLLAYASATHRRGARPVIRIKRRTVEKVFGFHNRNVTKTGRAKKIQKHVQALQSIFVRLQNVKRHGRKLHFRGDMTSGAPLWGLRMIAEGQQDLFTGETVADWHLEAREGMWAEEFLHEYGDQWAPLPKEWFQKIDRRGSRNYAQRLAVYLLFQFRINAGNGNRVVKKVQTLLKVCGEDMTRSRSSKHRSELKRCLSNALDTVERDYGIQVHAGRAHMDKTKGMDFEAWKNRSAAFDPPPSMDGHLFQNAEGEAPPLPDVAGDWQPNQIRHLRTEVLDETQPELGSRLDVSKQYVSQLERGTSQPSTRVRKILDRLQARPK